MPIRDIPEPLAVAAEILEKAAHLGCTHAIDARDLSFMSPADEERYVVGPMCEGLAHEWLKKGVIERSVKRYTEDRLGRVEYRADVILLSVEEWNVLKNAVAAAVRREQALRRDLLSPRVAPK